MKQSKITQLQADFKQNVPLASNEISKENKVTPTYVTLFFSFDIVNSTQYKTIALHNSISIIRKIFQRIEELLSKNLDIIQYWRTIGDEIIFYLEVYKSSEIVESVEVVFAILNRIQREIHNGEIRLSHYDDDYNYKYPELISIKATAWLAVVSEDGTKNASNIKYNVGYMTNDNRLEFQGYDIDIGFRVAQYTRNRRFALSFELAYLISEYKKYQSNLKFIGYRKMKGVWNQRRYPIIWYHNTCLVKLHDEKDKEENLFVLPDFEESFFYDEDDFCELTKDYKDPDSHFSKREKKKDIPLLLQKIAANLNLEKKIQNIKNEMKDKDSRNRTTALDKRIELHISVIISKENQLLLFKRTQDQTYDFGYAKYPLNKLVNFEFPSILKDVTAKYLSDFGVNISINPNIFKYYNIEKTNKKIIGLRFKGTLDSENENPIHTISHQKYTESQYISLENYKNFSYPTNANEFHEIITSVLKEGQRELQ